MKVIITPPKDPETLEEWQAAVDAADALLHLDAAQLDGTIRGGPDVDVARCWDLIYRAEELHGIVPMTDAVERLVEALGVEETA